MLKKLQQELEDKTNLVRYMLQKLFMKESVVPIRISEK